MLFKDFISNCKERDTTNYNKKVWVDYNTLTKHFTDEDIPGRICEEWKNFDTSNLHRVSWALPDYAEENASLKKEVVHKNCIVFVDGIYNPALSNIEDKNGMNIIPLEEYINHNEEAKNFIYNSPLKYSENRLSGKKDTKSTTLLSINTILNTGIAVIIDSKKVLKVYI